MSQSPTAEPLAKEPTPPADVPSAMTQLVRQFPWVFVILLAHLPLLLVHLSWLWRKPQYQFFPILLGVVGYLIWTRLQPLPSDTRGPRRRGIAYTLLMISLVILAGATLVVYSPWLAAFSLWLSFGAVLLLISERFHLQNRFGVWLLLVLLLPLPLNYDEQFSRFLQQFTTFVSAEFLTRIEVPNIADGTILTLPSKQLFVEEACSGIVSMMSIITACLILSVMANRPAIHTVLLVASGIVWTSTTNVLRIVTLAYSQERLGIDLSEGWRHDLLGLCLFAIAVLLALSADRLLGFLLAPIDQDEYKISRSVWSIRLWNRLALLGAPTELPLVDESYLASTQRLDGKSVTPHARRGPVLVFGAGFLCLGMAGMAVNTVRMLRANDRVAIQTPAGLTAFVNGMNASTMPAEINGWQLIDYGQTHAERLFAQDSRLWTYRKGDLQAIFSVDFVFDHWHDLRICYGNIGWEESKATQLRLSPDAAAGDYLQCEFSKPPQAKGFLLFSHLQHDGTPVPSGFGVAGKLTHRIAAELFGGPQDKHYFQVQYWVTANRPIRDEERASAETVFQQLRQNIQQQLKNQT